MSLEFSGTSSSQVSNSLLSADRSSRSTSVSHLSSASRCSSRNVFLVEAEVVERVRRLTSQMRFVDALTLCDEELKRVEETFNRKHQKKHKKWLSKFNAQTQDARDVIATDFVVNFHAMAVSVAITSQAADFLHFHSDPLVRKLFPRRSIRRLPLAVRGVAGATLNDSARAMSRRHGVHLSASYKQAMKLLEGLPAMEWRCKYAEARSRAASSVSEKLAAVRSFKQLDFSLLSLERQGHLLASLLTDLCDKSKTRKKLKADDVRLVCEAACRLQEGCLAVQSLVFFTRVFARFCHAHRHDALVASPDDVNTVFKPDDDVSTAS